MSHLTPYRDIGDPSRVGWMCPGCLHPNLLSNGLIKCEACDHSLDQKKVRQAIQMRRQRLSVRIGGWLVG